MCSHWARVACCWADFERLSTASYGLTVGARVSGGVWKGVWVSSLVQVSLQSEAASAERSTLQNLSAATTAASSYRPSGGLGSSEATVQRGPTSAPAGCVVTKFNCFPNPPGSACKFCRPLKTDDDKNSAVLVPIWKHHQPRAYLRKMLKSSDRTLIASALARVAVD